MFRLPIPGRAAAWLALVLLAAPLAAQKSAEEAQKMPLDHEKAVKALDTAEQQKILGQLAGSWDGSLKVFLHGNPPPEVSATDTNTTDWTLGGLWIQSESLLKFPGTPDITWRILMGYNPSHKNYVRIALSSQDPRETISTGTYDAATKTFTFKGVERSPVTGDDFGRRDVIKLVDPDKFTWEIFYTFQDGSELRAFNGTYTRKKTGK